MSRFEMLLRSLLGVILLAVWLLLVYVPPHAGGDALLTFVQMALAALAGHSMRPGNAAP